MHLQVVNQRRAQVAAGLLTGIGRKILAKQIEGLLAGAQRAPVGGRVHETGVGQRLDPRLERPVHVPGFHHLVAEERRVRVTRGPLTAGENRLTGGAIPHEPGQAQVGRPGDDPFLAGGQEEARPAFGD